MADSDKTLELLLKLGVIGRDEFERANQLLEQARKSATDLGDAESEAAKEGEKFAISQREAGHILKEVGDQIVPGTGRALGELRLGLLGVGLAAASVFEGIREKIKKTNEDLDAMGERAAEAYSNVKSNLFDALRDESFSTDKVDAFFKHIEDGSKKAETAIESALKVAHELESATSKKLKTDEQAELDRIASDATLTPDQKKQRAAEVKRKYGIQLAGLDEQGQQDEVNAAQAELWEKQNKLQTLQNQLPDTRSGGVSADRKAAIDKAIASLPENNPLRQQFDKDRAAGAVDYSKIDNDAIQKNIESELSQVQKKLGLDDQTGKMTDDGDAKKAKDLREQIENSQAYKDADFTAQNAASMLKNPNLSPAQRQSFEEYKSFAEKQKAALLSDATTADAAVSADKDRIEQLKNHAAQIKQAADKDKELNDKIDALKAEVEAAVQKLKQANTIAGIQTDATQYGVGSGEASAALGLDKTTAAALRSGRTVSPGAANQLIQDASVIAGHTVSLQEAVTVIQTGANNINAFMVQLQRLTTAFSRLTPAGLESLEKRIDKLEAQIQYGGFNNQ